MQKSLGSSRANFSGKYFLYILYSSWNEAREGKPPCIKSRTDTIPWFTETQKLVSVKRRWSSDCYDNQQFKDIFQRLYHWLGFDPASNISWSCNNSQKINNRKDKKSLSIFSLRGNTQLRRPFFSIFLLNIFSFYLTFSWKLLDFEERKIMHKLLKVQKKKRKREEKILKYFAEPASHEEQYQHSNYQASSSFHCSAGHERNCQYPLFKIKL